MKLYEAVLPALRAVGVEAVFGLMGDGNLRLIASLADEGGLPYFAARHESAAVCMARGYAHASGRLGVVSLTEGPGLTNALTAIVEADRAREPVLVLAGDTPAGVRRHNQDIDQHGVPRALGVEVEKLRSPRTFPADLVAAARRAYRQRRPVLVSVPTDWQTQEVELRWAAETAVEPPVATAAAVERAAELLKRSRRPVILAGRGLYDPGRRPAVEALADRIGAALTTSLVAKGAFNGHPYDLGVSGGMASEVALQVIEQADLAIVLGCSLTYWTTRGGTLFKPGLEMIQCDLDPAAIVEAGAASLPVVGEAADFAARLEARLAADGFSNRGFHSEALRRRLTGRRETPPPTPGAELDPLALTVALEALIPKQRTIVQDGGHFSGWAPGVLTVPDQRGFDWGQSFMAVGLGIGAAIGAAIGRPDRRTVLICGDGGLLMSLGDLESVSRLRLPMLVVVYNDHAYGAEIGILEALGLPTSHAYHSDVDLAAVASALSFHGVTIRSLGDLDAVAGAIADPGSRVLLDCKVDPGVRGKWFQEAFGKDSWLERMAAAAH